MKDYKDKLPETLQKRFKHGSMGLKKHLLGPILGLSMLLLKNSTPISKKLERKCKSKGKQLPEGTLLI